MKTSGTGNLTVSVIAGGGHTDLTAALSTKIADHVGTDQSDANTYVRVDLPFNTGANDTVSILVTNEGVESRLDDVSITAN